MSTMDALIQASLEEAGRGLEKTAERLCPACKKEMVKEGHERCAKCGNAHASHANSANSAAYEGETAGQEKVAEARQLADVLEKLANNDVEISGVKTAADPGANSLPTNEKNMRPKWSPSLVLKGDIPKDPPMESGGAGETNRMKDNKDAATERQTQPDTLLKKAEELQSAASPEQIKEAYMRKRAGEFKNKPNARRKANISGGGEDSELGKSDTGSAKHPGYHGGNLSSVDAAIGMTKKDAKSQVKSPLKEVLDHPAFVDPKVKEVLNRASQAGEKNASAEDGGDSPADTKERFLGKAASLKCTCESNGTCVACRAKTLSGAS